MIDNCNIIITEYPKCGGSWLTTLIGDTLQIPKRDIYINDETFYTGIAQHPWYEGADSLNIVTPCVIKSHELPSSPLINFNANYLHLVRDGRDVIISKYFFEKDFCVTNGLTDKFDISFDDYLVKTAREWKTYTDAWLNQNVPIIKYESLLSNTKETLIRLFELLNTHYTNEKLDSAIADNTKDKFSSKLNKSFKHNTFVRKGISGDWKNHLTKQQLKVFFDITGDTLYRLGYEKKPLHKKLFSGLLK